MFEIQIANKNNVHQTEDLGCLLVSYFLLCFWYFIRDNFVCLLEQHCFLSATCQLITGDTCSSSHQTSYCHTWAPIIVNSTKHRRAVEAGPREIAAATAARHAEEGFCLPGERWRGASLSREPNHLWLHSSNGVFSYAVVLNRCVVGTDKS